MINESLLTHDNLDAIKSWLNGETDQKPEFAEPFVHSLIDSFTKRTGINPARSRGAGTKMSLQNILLQAEKEEEYRRQQKEQRQAPAAAQEASHPAETPKPKAPDQPKHLTGTELPITNEEGFVELKIDSVTIARAIAYAYTLIDDETRRGRALSMNLMQITLYIVYGFYLAQRKTRLVSEHPQVWKFGPVFPRVYNKSEESLTPKQENYEWLEKEEPALASFLQQTLKRCIDNGVSNTISFHTRQNSAFEKKKRQEPDKMGIMIADTDIEKEFLKYLQP